MMVTEANFQRCVDDISVANYIGLDTETTGLHWWKDRLFCILIQTEKEGYYFNFNPNSPAVSCLPRGFIQRVQPALSNPSATVFIANAKYDLHMLANEGLSVSGNVWCLSAQERVLKNNRMPNQYSLDAIAKSRLGVEKIDIKSYIMKHKLYTKIDIPGKKKGSMLLHYDKIPFEEMQPYAEKDMSLHLRVGMAQREALSEMRKIYPSNGTYGSVDDVVQNELKLTKTCFTVERKGIIIRREYTEKALAYETVLLGKAKESFQALTGLPYSDSRATFVPAFERLGIPYPLTEKGNPSFAAEVLEEIDNPAAKAITTVRHHEKRIGTYYSSFLHFADRDGIVHANIRQGGTETGRMSYSDPNLQNVPKEDDEEDKKKPFLVRGCFAPREDHCFVMVDWKQQEFRMLLDYAGEKDAIKKIMDGEDPYIATALLCNITRKQAKVVVLALQYGMGIAKLARMLGVSEREASDVKARFFSGLPGVQRLLRTVQGVSKHRRYIRNWLGRVCFLDDIDYAYVMVNRLIQGGAGDCAKVAMNQVSDLLSGSRSSLLIQVHDELVNELHKGELDFAPRIASIMNNVYKPQNGMQLLTSTEHSWVSWAASDKVQGEPNVRIQATGT